MSINILVNGKTMCIISAGKESPRRLYEWLINHFISHEESASAEGWAEIASIGEEYELNTPMANITISIE